MTEVPSQSHIKFKEIAIALTPDFADYDQDFQAFVDDVLDDGDYAGTSIMGPMPHSVEYSGNQRFIFPAFLPDNLDDANYEGDDVISVGDKTLSLYGMRRGMRSDLFYEDGRINRKRVIDITAAQIGDVIVIAEDRAEEVIAELEQAPDGNVLRLVDTGEVFGLHPNGTYAAVTMAALQLVDFEDKGIIDFGCGVGPLGIYGLKNGGDSVLSLEINERDRANFNQNLQINGISPDRAAFEIKDLNEIDALDIQQLWKTSFPGEEEPQIAIANVGPHYGDTHLQIMKLIQQLLTFDTVVLGGFNTSADGNHFGIHLYPDIIENLCREMGLTNIVRVEHQQGFTSLVASKEPLKTVPAKAASSS